MVLAMFTIYLTQRGVAPHPPNRVFDRDPPPGKRLVEDPIFPRALLPARFAPRRHSQALRMRLGEPDVGQVPADPDPIGQTSDHPRLHQHGHVGG